ncbi:MAG: efflux RND transporter periplasmic adaptor subunit [Devosia sp.]
MIRQILVSLVIVGAAAVAYVFLVPGAPEQLARLGINLPVAQPVEAAATPGGQGAGAERGGPGGGQRFGGRGGARTMVVVTAPVLLATINDKLTAIGEGAAAHSVTVVSPAAGTLAEISVQPGQEVQAGAVIGSLDAEAEQIAHDRAKLSFDDAQGTLDRTKSLAGANNATTVQVNTAQLAFNTAELELKNAELALRKRTISTPIAGTVGLFQVSPGNAVTPQTVVTTVEDTSHIRVSFWVPERYAGSISVGMPVTAAAVALPGQTIAGEVSAVDNRIDPTSRTLQVEANIPNADGKLKPGMSFSVSMSFPGENFPSVDPLAIQWSSDGAYLWKYAEQKVQRVPVQIIQRNSDGVLVKAELREGDQVVTQGVQQLTAGATVRLLDEVADAGGGGGRKGGAQPASAL